LSKVSSRWEQPVTGGPQTASFADLFEMHRDDILLRFTRQVGKQELSPKGTSRSLLENQVPGFLKEIVAELRVRSEVRFTNDAQDTSDSAREHGEQRWELGYDLHALIREYGVLRHSILQVASELAVPISVGEFDVLAKCLNVGVAEAASAYAAHRDAELDQQRKTLEFLAEASELLGASLDYRATMVRLTGLIVPRLSDWCAVQLDGGRPEEMAIAHVKPEMVELVREQYRHYLTPAPGHPGYLDVMRTGEPLRVEAVDRAMIEALAPSPEHRALIEKLNVGSYLIVPLGIQGNTFGALTFAFSDSERRYRPPDLLVASELARRASFAIDNARLYEQSQQERSRVEAATRAKDEFVAMVSHELRTPLNAILGWTRLARSGSLPPDKQAHALEVIERNANIQSQVIADLLDISRVITGKIRIHPSQVDVSNIIEMAIEGVRPAADAKRIQISVELDQHSSIIRADGERLQQVVWSLLSNAIKFTPKSGKVEVRLHKVDSDIELVVQDNGRGIAADFLPHVFESFRQSDGTPSRPHGGLGIGLSIAKHLVELHGGSIGAHSEGEGHGARFVVRLPISSLVSTTLGISKVAATKTETQDPELVPNLEGIQVLVVDDEPDARELVGYVLSRSGIGVQLASSAAEAVDMLESFHPQVIISDIGMPGEDGYSLIRTIRTLGVDSKRNIPAIALTAFATNQDRTRALVEGFNLHMTKPVEPSRLIAAVMELAGPPRHDPSPSSCS
jgi:signal transduction histidine kinase/ActR/RegA family two-component response regulator